MRVASLGYLTWGCSATARASGAASTLVIVADPEYHAARVYRSVGLRDVEVQTEVPRAQR